MLSQENLDKIVWTGLYKHEPRKPKYQGDNVYHCTNWTFRPVRYGDGTIFMRDTYWGSSSDGKCIDLTDDNFAEFQFVFDFEKVKNVSQDIWNEYEDEDKYTAAHDSGGYTCGGIYFVKKDCKPSRKNKREILLYKISSLESSLQYARDELARLDTDDFYK